MSRLAVVVQARMGGTRFPGKVLQMLAGRVVLTHVMAAAVDAFDRASCYQLAIPDTAANDCLVGFGLYPWETIRGPDDDVLARFVLTANLCGLAPQDRIARITADDPYKSPPLMRRTAQLCTPDTPYVQSNHGQVEGLGCEVFTVALLREAQARRYPEEVLHVTAVMARLYPSPKVSLTVDTPQDLDVMRGLA